MLQAERKRLDWPRVTTVGLLGIGGAASLFVEYPGTLVYDSLIQVLEGRAHRYSFWHPPVMSWLLGLSDGLLTGVAAFVVVQTLVGFLALAGLVWSRRRVSWAAVPTAAVVLLLPQLLMYQGYVLKDVLFADAVLAGFVALLCADAAWFRRRRWGWLAAGALFFALATLTRQNGVLFLPFAAAALGGLAVRHGASWRRGAVWAVAWTVGALSVCLAANAAFARYDDGSDAVTVQFKLLRNYDLTGMAKRDPRLELPILEREAPGLAAALRGAGVVHYSAAKNDTLSGNPVIAAALDRTPAEVLDRQWRQAIATHPGVYLAQRAEVFGWLFGAAQVAQCHPFYVGVRGAPAHLQALGWQERVDARDAALFAYGTAMTPVFAHPLYAAVVALGLFFCLYRRRTADLVIAGLLGGTLVFVGSFFAISIACDYRYLYVLDLSAIAAALYIAADPRLLPRAEE